MSPGRATTRLTGARRFEIIRLLGEGGMGVVYEAFDRETRRKVALKTLRSLDAAALLRFKNEFRSLQDIDHPNLVSLGELFEEDGQLFFSMELVEGTPFVDYVRPGAPVSVEIDPTSSSVGSEGDDDEGVMSTRRHIRRCRARHPGPPAANPPPACFDEARLRDAFGQLARGIHTLHKARKVHRDIKPSNVLVTGEGRVVLLDFGLVMNVAPGEREDAIVGSAHYMAPEQAAGRPVGPEADWYSLGVMLYLAMTGVFPFRMSSDLVLEQKQEASPPPPSAWATGLPPDLVDLCVGLLRKSPSSRPTGSEVLHVLGADRDTEIPILSSRSAGFIGRRRELATLHQSFADARRGAPLAVLIEGESGVGKTALMRRFIEEVGGDAVILAGACHERESVPYKAVDEVIDALSRHLAGRWASEVEEILPPRAALLGSVFPVLRMIPAISRAKMIGEEAVDPHNLRVLVFATLRELLARLARIGPLVVAIDDLQWADVDSLSLLSEVMLPHDDVVTPPILLVATVRTTDPCVYDRNAPWSNPPEEMIRVVKLEPLPADEAEELVDALLCEARAPRGEIDVEALVEEAGGHPLFIDALLRHRLVEANDSGPARLDDVLWAGIQRLEPRAQALIQLCAVAGGPVPLAIAARALGAQGDELTRLIAVLRAKNLARKSGAGREEQIEPYHHRIREVVTSRLNPEVKRAFHERLARALEAQGSAELEALAVHFHEAGDAVRAAAYAVRAAEKAALALAFDRAARLYKMALDLKRRDRKERRVLLLRWGDALANAGRRAEAALAYLSADREGG